MWWQLSLIFVLSALYINIGQLKKHKETIKYQTKKQLPQDFKRVKGKCLLCWLSREAYKFLPQRISVTIIYYGNKSIILSMLKAALSTVVNHTQQNELNCHIQKILLRDFLVILKHLLQNYWKISNKCFLSTICICTSSVKNTNMRYP